VAGLGNNNLLLTMWWMVVVALSVVLLRSSAIMGEVAGMTIVEVDMGGDCSSGQWNRQV
jgi:hypothetical protein